MFPNLSNKSHFEKKKLKYSLRNALIVLLRAMNFFTHSDLLAFSHSGLVEHSEGPSAAHGHEVLLIVMDEDMAGDGQVAELPKPDEPAIGGNNFSYWN